MEILRLRPKVKDYIWGGQRLKQYGKPQEGCERIAECWELSVRADDACTVDGGLYHGKALGDVLAEWGRAALGKKAEQFEMFPQLIKFIDASDALSIQVHPNDQYALKYEGEYGKTEVWYIIEAEEGAGVYWGFKEALTREEFAKHIADGTVCEALRFVEAKPGDAFFIEAGTVHAICKGLLLAEIQQNSNLTYRVYDYGRLGADGLPRQTHVDKALTVTNIVPAGEKNAFDPNARQRVIADDKYFHVTEYRLDQPQTFVADDNSFKALVFVGGSGKIIFDDRELPYNQFQTFFVPSGLGEFCVVADKPTTVLVSEL